MGEKGDKLTKQSTLSTEEFLAQISEIQGVTSKKMFGGHGLFHAGKMFGLVDSKGRAFLKADDTTREEYLAQGGEQHSRMPYYSIPKGVLADMEQLLTWVKVSMALSKS